MKSPNPFSGGVDALSDADFALLVDAVETRRCRELVGAGTYDEAARKWRPRPTFPKVPAALPRERPRMPP